MDLVISLNGPQLDIANQLDLQFTSAMKQKVSDEQLMSQYAKGDAFAFEQLYSRHKGGLYRYCLRQLGSRSRAEECFQDIWMKIINSRSKYRSTALFSTYLYRVAQNHIIDILRKDKKLKQEVELEEDIHSVNAGSDSAEISSQLIRQGQYERLRTEIERLPIDQKTALLLKLDAGLSLEEIAQVLGCGRETVKSRLRYATNRLKTLIGGLI